VELEPDLLHPLASGGDVERHAFAPLGNLLLFPYRREDGEMRLLTEAELSEAPRTRSYLYEHEERLRGRESGKMDHEGWYGYVYPKSLGSHDSPKLGVPRLCEFLRAAVDPAGEVYLDNVDVNGILPREDGPSIWTLSLLLNSRAVDYVFRRSSVPFRGSFLSANKQFIAPLPIRVPDRSVADDFDERGQALHKAGSEILNERSGFLDWLGDLLGARLMTGPGSTRLKRYEELSVAEVIDVLRTARSGLTDRVTTRSFRDQLAAEHSASTDRLASFAADLQEKEQAADEAVFELYGLTSSQRDMINADYE
jgi:hypothetical protein